MKKNYFNTTHIDKIEIEEVADLLHYADRKADKLIRIVMDEEFNYIDIRGDEHEILQAVVFVEDRLGNFSRYDFDPEDTERCLYMAIDPKKFIAISIGDPEYPVDGIGEFEHKEAILGIFKTDDSTLMFIYKGTGDKIECRHFSNPSVFDIVVKAG
jgi:hypothetical protein